MTYLNSLESLFNCPGFSSIGLFILMILTCYYWMSNAGKELKVPFLILVIVVSSGHPLGTTIGNYFGLIALPSVALAILSFGVWYLIYGAKLLFKRLRNLNPQA